MKVKQRMEVISNETLLPLGMFIAGLAGAVGGGALYGRTKTKLEEHEMRLTKNEVRTDAIEKAALPMTERLARIETQQSGIIEILKEIRYKIKP